MIKITQPLKNAFQQDLVHWYERHHRDLPWRRTRDPYAITVSEFMLQQTQVVTVIPYYERWLRQFPDWSSLAQASETQVIKAWEGLGYYTRARNLQRLARTVVALPGGKLPVQANALRELPGIGPYTAGAIASIAFDQRAALLDGNVIRIVTRVFAMGEDVARPATQRLLWKLMEDFLPEADCGTYNQALMELGALVCTPRNPQCLICPLQAVCRAPDPEQFPVKARKKTETRQELVAVIEKKGRWWVVPGPTKGRLAGFWRFPDFSGKTMQRGKMLLEFTYGITKYRVRLTVVKARWKKSPVGPGEWVSREEAEQRPGSAAHRRIIAEVLLEKADKSIVS